MCRKRGTSSGRWITRERRLGIYLRDGLCCVYCGHGIEDGVKLTLDHLICKSVGEKPNHKSSNLVTCCLSCNSKRQDNGWVRFLSQMYRDDEQLRERMKHLLNCRRRKPRTAEAKKMIGSRTFTETMQDFRRAA